MEGKKDEDFEALSASFLDVDDEINNLSVAAEKEDVILLRFPICCVIGHSYIGKTKLLNYIRGAADFEFEDNTTTKRITATYQSTYTQNAFNVKLTKIITQFKEHGLSTEIYWRNKEMGETVSIVPTSASSGEGIPDLLLLLAMWPSKTMVDKPG
ncbi:photosystem II [Trifolium repens]|nr:photosystem II [Trifolium repens]